MAEASGAPQGTLVLGYGNADRQDDGAAWHVLAGLAQRLGRPPGDEPGESIQESFAAGRPLELRFVLQLTPELAETLAGFERVAFVDAHTGSLEADLRLAPVDCAFQASPLTHHLTPETCLALCQALYGRVPEAVLISVRGYEFGFNRSLSPATAGLVSQAVDRLWDWLKVGQS